MQAKSRPHKRRAGSSVHRTVSAHDPTNQVTRQSSGSNRHRGENIAFPLQQQRQIDLRSPQMLRGTSRRMQHVGKLDAAVNVPGGSSATARTNRPPRADQRISRARSGFTALVQTPPLNRRHRPADLTRAPAGPTTHSPDRVRPVQHRSAGGPGFVAVRHSRLLNRPCARSKYCTVNPQSLAH